MTDDREARRRALEAELFGGAVATGSTTEAPHLVGPVAPTAEQIDAEYFGASAPPEPRSPGSAGSAGARTSAADPAWAAPAFDDWVALPDAPDLPPFGPHEWAILARTEVLDTHARPMPRRRDGRRAFAVVLAGAAVVVGVGAALLVLRDDGDPAPAVVRVRGAQVTTTAAAPASTVPSTVPVTEVPTTPPTPPPTEPRPAATAARRSSGGGSNSGGAPAPAPPPVVEEPPPVVEEPPPPTEPPTTPPTTTPPTTTTTTPPEGGDT